MKVYEAINKVQTELVKTGITKDRTNSQQGSGYKFRGIDDVYNTISPLLAQNGLCILPRMLARECVERQSKSGGALFYVTVEAEFDFVAAEDGSKHTVKTFGEAMDSGDKATNKAMSAAYKYAAFQAFAIPTEADNDADAHTHEVRPAPKITARPQDGMQVQDFPPADQEKIVAAANVINLACGEGRMNDATKAWLGLEMDQEKKTAVWFLLEEPSYRATITKLVSKLRAA